MSNRFLYEEQPSDFKTQGDERELFISDISPWPIIQSFFGSSCQIEDRTHLTPRDKRKRERDMSKVYALVLHQTAGNHKNDPANRYDQVTAHFVIKPNGQILQLHPLSSYLYASHGLNAGSVAVEFAGNFPNTKGKWHPSGTSRRHHVSAEQIEAGRCLVRYLIREMGLTHILAHRQSHASRANDPGPDIWYHVGQWAIDNHGLKDGGPGFKVDSGQPIPDLWRTWGKAKPRPELEAISDLESEDFERPATTIPTPGRYYDIQYGQGGLLNTASKQGRDYVSRRYHAQPPSKPRQLSVEEREADFVPTEKAPDPACNKDKFVLSCFRAYETSLEPWHEEQLDAIGIDMATRSIDGKPVTHILITGHAAYWKDSDPQFRLGLERAKSVAKELQSRFELMSADIAKTQLIPISLSDFVPVASNTTKAGRRLNRRVTVHLLSTPPPKQIECEPLSDEELPEVVMAIFGKAPKKFEVAKELFEFIKRSNNIVCKSIGKRGGVIGREAQLLCMFLSGLAEVYTEEFKDDPASQLNFIRGVAYGLMDSATNLHRRDPQEGARKDPFIRDLAVSKPQAGIEDELLKRYAQAFEMGYRQIQGRILTIRQDAASRKKLDENLAAIACRKSRRLTLKIIYETIREVTLSEVKSMGGKVFLSVAGSGKCNDYPRIRLTDCSTLLFQGS